MQFPDLSMIDNDDLQLITKLIIVMVLCVKITDPPFLIFAPTNIFIYLFVKYLCAISLILNDLLKWKVAALHLFLSQAGQKQKLKRT